MQRRPALSDISLPIAIFVKLFISALITIILAVVLVFVTTSSTGKLKPVGTPRPTQTRVVKTPFSLFGIKKPTSTPIPTIQPSAVVPPTALPTNPAPTESQVIPQPEQPTATPEVIPTEVPAPTAIPAANITTLQGGIQIPPEPFRADNLAFLHLIGQLGKGRINQVLWAPDSQSGNLVAATTGGFFYLNPTDGTEAASVNLSTGIHSSAISPDGSLLATSGMDNTVTVWSYGTNQPVFQINAQGIHINVLVYSL